MAAAPVLMSKSKSDGQFPPPPYFIVGDASFQSETPVKQPVIDSTAGAVSVSEAGNTEESKVPLPAESSTDEPANLPDILHGRPQLMRYASAFSWPFKNGTEPLCTPLERLF